ncbi:hypothetical protein [Crocinitomix algicola]|uniref:hypothetical protein n=1 Tax=Crocinitomix algicola TaxID=1740263 RepID=UPI001112F759|nr:hypothetical protein [Crocinitomix algicola]
MKRLFGICAMAAFLGSCTVGHQITVTNNPVGTKTGVAKGTNFSKDLDITAEKACSNGGITKIGTMEFKATQILFFVKFKTTVTGE